MLAQGRDAAYIGTEYLQYVLWTGGAGSFYGVFFRVSDFFHLT